MERGTSPNCAITYANDKNADGAGAQLQRIYGIYAVSRALSVPYFHSPIKELGYHGLASLENNSPTEHLLSEFNRVFHIPSDVDLPEDHVIHEMRDADAGSIEAAQKAGSDDQPFNLIRILYPYSITDQNPEMYRCLRAITPFRRRASPVFRLAIHVRRGELYAIFSDRMLPNSYYVSAALSFQAALKKLDIPFVCELYTEVPSKPFVVTPQHHGIEGRIQADVSYDPAMNHLEDFDTIPNLEKFINTSPIDTLERMATADALILSRSSFSYLAALLSPKCTVIYYPFWHAALSDWLIADENGVAPESELIDRLDLWKREAEFNRTAARQIAMHLSRRNHPGN